jgi:hypothetical protein
VNGMDVIGAMRRNLRVTTDRALASRLGITEVSIQNWKNRSNVTPRQLSGLLQSAAKAATKDFQVTAIRPLVEFYRIDKCESSQGANYELFRITDHRDSEHPYKKGLRDELDSTYGVYVFFDSRGRAIYAGKAKRQSLWKEMTLAFNRDRREVQKIKRVRHPENRVTHRTADEKTRQIMTYDVPHHQLAVYCSAYKVVDGMIDELEPLLVRSFANDLLNIKMERFKSQRKRKQ